MSYCTVEDLRRILPENILIGDQNIGRPVPGRVGNQGSSRSNLSPDEAQRYISDATQYVDSRLRPYYSCPLRRTKSFETEILSDVSPGTSISITVHDSGSFIIGQHVRLQNKYQMETATVSGTPDMTTVTLDSVVNSYLSAEKSRISVLEYPDPIPITVARLACSFILDRLFVAQQSPDVSNYGKTQRNLARNAMDGVLTGEILLFGQEHTGRRFVRGSLIEPFKSPADIQRGDEREG